MNDTKDARADPLATLLVVDDNPDNGALLSELLKAEYRMLAATSGRRRSMTSARWVPDHILL